MLIRSLAIALSFATASAAQAQDTVVSLTAEQREHAIEAAAQVNHDGELPINGLSGSSRQIHGEIGAMVGTGGARGVFGTVIAPVGDNAMVGFSYENTRYGRSRYGY